MNYQCDDHGAPCLDRTDYDRFDVRCTAELKNPVSVHEIINESYCRSLALDQIKQRDPDELDLNDLLRDLNKKIGIYHLWVENGYCQDHGMHSFLCVYVGKSIDVNGRIRVHIKNKWPTAEMLYVTFYECENRTAKYLEQLFLDNYEFNLNTEENRGAGYLHARWDEKRALFGTQLEQDAMLAAKKSPTFRDLFGE